MEEAAVSGMQEDIAKEVQARRKQLQVHHLPRPFDKSVCLVSLPHRATKLVLLVCQGMCVGCVNLWQRHLSCCQAQWLRPKHSQMA